MTNSKMTLLAALWENDSNEAVVVGMLDSGALQLTGNFKNHEAEIVVEWKMAEAA